jgi:predicted amidohydrolase
MWSFQAFSSNGRSRHEYFIRSFLTDTQNGYTRVKHCAQARTIENECYVAIAGCVGNLPKVNNMDIQYAQAAVYTPLILFPSNGSKLKQHQIPK